MKAVSGNASIETSTESPRWTRTPSVSSTFTLAWMTDRSETVSSRLMYFEKVLGTATSHSYTASRVTQPVIGAPRDVIRRLSRDDCTEATTCYSYVCAAFN